MLLESELEAENKLSLCASVGQKINLKVKVKIKLIVEQTNKAQRGRRGIALLFL
jgi:hypothetical protein